MIEVEQTILTEGDGNCYQACLASILELPLEAVPHIYDGKRDKDAAWDMLQRWLTGMGLLSLFVEREGGDDSPEWPGWSPSGLWIATHVGPRGVNHATVWHGPKIVWNPYPGSPADGSDLAQLVMVEWFMAADPALLARNLPGRWRRSRADRHGQPGGDDLTRVIDALRGREGVGAYVVNAEITDAFAALVGALEDRGTL